MSAWTASRAPSTTCASPATMSRSSSGPRRASEGVPAMKAAVYYQPGGPEVFRYEDVPDPELTPDELLVRVEAISVEGGDTLHRATGELAAAPHVVGYGGPPTM